MKIIASVYIKWNFVWLAEYTTIKASFEVSNKMRSSTITNANISAFLRKKFVPLSVRVCPNLMIFLIIHKW